ncbi:3975_t:CDS:2 [Scutellospora calospora]|uniref:3975_t:CDS:1 n=1 Tax=Scutellospora calospora TaxID=85575 RepID=A0ACA9KK87_9GLOM|nr:3975_t:CDS:2 [Scutellospora calospora]
MTNSEMSQNVSKKMRYSTKFGVLKKALNLAISLECDDKLLDILHQFIGDKQKLSTNYLISNNNKKNDATENQKFDNLYISIQVADPLVSIFKESNNTYTEIDQDTKFLTNNQVQEGVVNKYKCRICSSLEHNAQNKKKCLQQNSV